MCSMHSINSGTSHNKAAMDLLRELFWLSAVHNFHISAEHIAGSDNTISDFLSRLPEHQHWPRTLLAWGFAVHNLYKHMTYQSFLLLQGTKMNGRNLGVSAQASNKRPGQHPPKRRIAQCKTNSSGFVYSLAKHQYQPRKKRYCCIQCSSRVPWHPPAYQDI